uniref:PISTILLATA-like protein n=1 Tax=Schoepfia jasminodora TaxID=212711 RepID=K7QUY3_9MAGN|nr:PISTILLATA-like protein [Schoepfia jasminodora]
MARGKMEIKRIENSSNRQVTYSKRRNGIIKKAKEITVLCDAQVSLVIFASSGKMHEFCSPSTQVVDILDRYHKHCGSSGKKLWDAKHEDLSHELERIKKENDSMQIQLRHLKGHDITSLPLKELMATEEALDTGLDGIREKQSELVKMIKRNAKMLEDENRELTFTLQKMAMEGGDDGKDMTNGYIHQAGNARNYGHHNQMPFAFRVQPMQPNLQERM